MEIALGYLCLIDPHEDRCEVVLVEIADEGFETLAASFLFWWLWLNLIIGFLWFGQYVASIKYWVENTANPKDGEKGINDS